jgi:hypothetical protein
MPTPARGPQTTPPDEGPNNHHDTRPPPRRHTPLHPRQGVELSSVVCSIVAFFIARRAAIVSLWRRPHSIARSRALRLDGRATRERAVQHRTLRSSPSTLPRPSRPKEAPLASSASRALLLPPSAVQRFVVCVLPVRFRILSLLQLEQEHWASVGSHGTFPVTSVALAASFGSSASGVPTRMGHRGYRANAEYRAVWDTMALRDTVDTVPLRDTVPYGHRAHATLATRVRAMPTRGANVPVVLRTARTMPSMALTVLTRGTVARRKPPLIGV